MQASAPPIEESWNLTDLFADETSFEAARNEVVEQIASLDRWRGKLAGDSEQLADALDTINDVSRRFAALRCYATLRSDVDTRDATAQALRQGIERIATDFSERTAYLAPEILGIDPEIVEAFIRESPRLTNYAFYLRDLMREREHVLSEPEEALLAASSLISRGPANLYNVLHNADMPRKTVRLEDETEVELTPVAFHAHRSSTNRKDRLAVFPAFFESYSDFRETLGQNLYAATSGHLFRSRARGYDSCLAAALSRDNIPLPVYRNLIARVRENLDVLHRYFRLRARALGLEQLTYADLYCPLVPAPPPQFGAEESRILVSDSLAPLGPRYREVLEQAFRSRWIDWHPRPGKRSGAYSSGWAYDVHPYVLTNFNGDYESVSTLTHEMGHALHSYFSNSAQTFANADYSIFVAEVASTLNEALLVDHVSKTATAREDRLAILSSYLDGMRGTLFRQTMFAEFELEIHERVERGEVLTGERLSELYLRIVRDYLGHDQGVVRVDDYCAVEWAAIPHFYYNFYVYQYSTGIVAATALSEGILRGETEARERYLAFLHAGRSGYSLDLLREAGVDLLDAQPYNDVMVAIARRLDQLEGLIEP